MPPRVRLPNTGSRFLQTPTDQSLLGRRRSCSPPRQSCPNPAPVGQTPAWFCIQPGRNCVSVSAWLEYFTSLNTDGKNPHSFYKINVTKLKIIPGSPQDMYSFWQRCLWISWILEARKCQPHYRQACYRWPNNAICMP